MKTKKIAPPLTIRQHMNRIRKMMSEMSPEKKNACEQMKRELQESMRRFEAIR